MFARKKPNNLMTAYRNNLQIKYKLSNIKKKFANYLLIKLLNLL